MNYQKIYNNIIQHRLNTPLPKGVYTEKHHIIPRSLGGSNDKNNLIDLLAREHFICHLLLTKMYPEKSIEWVKMIKAFMSMFRVSYNQERIITNKWYEYLKINFSKAQHISQFGKNNSQYGTVWISNFEFKKCIKIKINELEDYLNKGWVKQRIINWSAYTINEKNTYIPPKLQDKYLENKRKILENKKYYKELYEIYKVKGFKGVKKEKNYKYSRVNLVMQFKRYVPEYKPFERKKFIKKK